MSGGRRRRGWSGRRGLLFAAAFGAGLFGLEVLGLDTSVLTRDTAAVASVPFWSGAISTLGLMLWTLAVGACLVAGLVLNALPGQERMSRLLLATAGLVTLIALDDALQFHERIAPDYLGIPQPAAYAVLALPALAYAIRFRVELMEGDRLLLCLGVGLLVLSAGADNLRFLASLPGVTTEQIRIVEDIAKEVGRIAFVAWCFDSSRAALAAVAQAPSMQPASASSVASKSVLATAPTHGDVTPASRVAPDGGGGLLGSADGGQVLQEAVGDGSGGGLGPAGRHALVEAPHVVRVARALEHGAVEGKREVGDQLLAQPSARLVGLTRDR